MEEGREVVAYQRRTINADIVLREAVGSLLWKSEPEDGRIIA